MTDTKQQKTADLKEALNPAESQSLPAQSSFDNSSKPHSSTTRTKQSKKLKHQQKLARLVANTFGPDSLDLFKSTMNAAAAVESAVSAHAITKSLTNKNNKKKVSCTGDSVVGSESSHNNSLRASTASPALTTALPTSNGNQSSMSQSKTTNKLNRKFNLLQKKITSLIESNHLEPFAMMAPEMNALAKAASAKSQKKRSTSKEDKSLCEASSAGATKTDLAVNVKDYKNLVLEDDEVSEIESFVFNEDDEDEEDLEEEPSLESQLKKEGYLCGRQGGNTAKYRRETEASDTGAGCSSGDLDLDAAIDSDTRLKLEALLASAGVESVTADLLKDPHIMQALTSTYVRTLNEVVSRSAYTANNTKTTNNNSNDNTELKALCNSDSSRDLVLPTQEQQQENNMLLLTGSDEDEDQEDDDEDDEEEEDDDVVLDEVVESTFEEFILAAAALAAATADSVGNSGASSASSNPNPSKSSLNRPRRCAPAAQLSIQLNQKKFESHMDSFYGLNGRCGGDSIADLKERLNDISRLSKELENYNVEEEEDGEDKGDSDDVEDEEGNEEDEDDVDEDDVDEEEVEDDDGDDDELDDRDLDDTKHIQLLTEKSAQNELKLNTLLNKFTQQLHMSESLSGKKGAKSPASQTPSLLTTNQLQQQQRLSKIEQINLINSVVNNADLNFDPSRIVAAGAEFKPPKKMNKAANNNSNNSDLSLTLSLPSNQQNGLVLFSTATGSNKSSRVGNNTADIENPESILSKLVELRSNADGSSEASHQLVSIDDKDKDKDNNNSQAVEHGGEAAAAAQAVAAVAAKKLIVGKSLTELLEENADSVLGLACASGYIELVTVLLAINANVEDKGHKNESTPLMEACANGHKQIVQLLLKHGANVNAQSSSGNSPLHSAVLYGHSSVVELLVEWASGALKLEEPNENGHTPLMEAASAGDVECVRILLDAGANVNTHSHEFKETGLTLAAYKGHAECVAYLLARGADHEHRTDEMHTALMEACMDGHLDVARLLIDAGAEVNMPADSFESPLTLAACGGHVELANLLIDHRADLEERNDEGYTPLMEAAREGHEEMVALLLFHDADINAMTEETQETALTLACCGGCYEVAKFLLEAGADANLGTASTPLMEAAQEGHLELVQLLIKAGAHVNKFTSAVVNNNTTSSTQQSGNHGNNNNNNNNNNSHKSNNNNNGNATATSVSTCESALTLSCENGHTDVVDALIKAGADIDRPDPDKGFTPLMKAARTGQYCTAQYLLANYAAAIDINRATNHQEHSALSLACQNGHLQVVELLLQYGANPLQALKDNSNCLIEASKGGHTKIVELLIDWNYTLNMSSADAASSKSALLEATATTKLVGDGDGRSQKECPMVAESGGHLVDSVGKQCDQGLVDWLEAALPDDCCYEIGGQLIGGAKKVMAAEDKWVDNLVQGQQCVNGSAAEPALVKQIKRSVSRLESTSDIGLENLVNVLHHFAFGDSRSDGSPAAASEALVAVCDDAVVDTQAAVDKKLKNGEDAAAGLNCHFLNINSEFRDLLLENKKLVNLQNLSNVLKCIEDAPAGSASGNGEVCSCTAKGHEAQTITEAIKLKQQQQDFLSDVSYFDEEDEDEQIKRKENLLQELLKIERQLDSQRSLNNNTAAKSASKTADEIACSNNYDHISMINKYLIKKCQYDLNRLYKIKLKQLQQKPLELAAAASSKNLQQQGQSKVTAPSVLAAKGAGGKKRLISSSSSSSSSTSCTINKVAQQQQQHQKTPESVAVALKENTPTGNGIIEGEGLSPSLSGSLSSLSLSSISNSLIEFKRLSNSKQQQQQQESPAGTGKKSCDGSASILNGTSGLGSALSTPVSLSDIQTTLFFKSSGQKQSQTTTNKSTTQVLEQNHQPSPPPPSIPTPPVPQFVNTNNANSSQQLTKFSKDQTPNQIKSLMQQQAQATGTSATTKTQTKTNQNHLCPHVHGHDHDHRQHIQQHQHHHSTIHANALKTATSTNNTTTVIAKQQDNHHNQQQQEQQPVSPTSSTSSSSDDWLPPPPPPFAAAAAYLIQQSMKNKASQNNYPHIDLDTFTESNHDTALTVACSGGHEDLVKLLIEKGAHIEHRDKKGFTPLILAATLGYARIVQLLLIYGADVEAQSERNKDTALSAAAQAGKYDCCEVLLSKGQANKEHRNISDYTPLSLAASGGYVAILRLLLDYGADINSRTGSKLGISPLMLASMNGHTQAVRLLIDLGSDVNAQIETNRNTALTLACFQGRSDVVALLLERKAHPEHRAKTGLTPLMEAASGGYDQVGRVLLENGAEVNAAPVPTTKDTALTIAADKGHLKFIELLIEYGAQLDAKNKKGCTALWLACHNGHLEVAQTLIANMADTEACDSRRVSCLMVAFRKGHIRICKHLVKHVRQFPADHDCKRYINSLTDGDLPSNASADKDLLKRSLQCMELIFQAKDRQAQEANRVANSLLKEIESEKSREQNKKLAAQRKREKKKLKKQQQNESEAKEEMEVKKQLEEQREREREEAKALAALKAKAVVAESSESVAVVETKEEADKKGAVAKASKKSKKKKKNKHAQTPTITASSTAKSAEKKAERMQAAVANNTVESDDNSSQADNDNESDENEADEIPVPEVTSKKSVQAKMPANPTVPIKAPTLPTTSKVKEEPKQQIASKQPAKQSQDDKTRSKSQASSITSQSSNNTQSRLASNPRPVESKRQQLQTPLGTTGTATAAASGLSALDDFDQPSYTQQVVKGKTATTTPNSNNNNNNNLRPKQRIVVPHDRFVRVMGRGNCNLKVIQEVTGAQLEVEDKKIPPNQDRSILIRGDSLDITRYAFELLQALINDSDVDLLNLLPANKQQSLATQVSAVKPKQSTMQHQANKWNTDAIKTAPTTTKQHINPAYNPLLGGVSLLNDRNQPTQQQQHQAQFKPRNFAEVVAKQASSSTSSSHPISPSQPSKTLRPTMATTTAITPSNQPNKTSLSPANFPRSTRRHNSVSPSSANSTKSLTSTTAPLPSTASTKVKPILATKTAHVVLPNSSHKTSNNTVSRQTPAQSATLKSSDNNSESKITVGKSQPADVSKPKVGVKPISIVSPYGKKLDTKPAPVEEERRQNLSGNNSTNNTSPAFSSLFNNNNYNNNCQTRFNLEHPGASPSAPLLSNAVPPITNRSTLSSSNSSSTSSSTNSNNRLDMNSDQTSTAFTAPLSENNNSLDSFITSASIIGGMNPIWSFGDGKQQQLPSNQSLSNRAFGATSDNILEDESILGLSTNPSVLPIFANNSQQLHQQTQALPLSFGNESPSQSINNSGSSSNSSNKPIGFERHEKQIHSSGHVNVGSSPFNMVGGVNGNNGVNGGNGGGFNMNMAIGLQLNTLNLDDFSYLYNNLNALNHNNNSDNNNMSSATPPPNNTAFLSNNNDTSSSSSKPNLAAQQNPQMHPFQVAGDLSNLSLPLATQWLINNNLMNSLNSATAAANNSPLLASRAPFMNLNQSLSSLLPAFLSNPQLATANAPGAKMAGASFPSVDMLGLNQQFQTHQLNNLEFQSQLIDSLKNNANWNASQMNEQYMSSNNYKQHIGSGPQLQQQQQSQSQPQQQKQQQTQSQNQQYNQHY